MTSTRRSPRTKAPRRGRGWGAYTARRGSTAKAGRLPEFDFQLFCFSARRAFESPQIVIRITGWLDPRKHGERAALGTLRSEQLDSVKLTWLSWLHDAP